jgi:antirestriction protein
MARVYVGTYAKYNAGNLAGKWLDLEDYNDKDEFIDACKELHSDESDPELMFQDNEDVPSCWISESSIEQDVWEWLELDERERVAFALYAEHVGGADYSSFQDAYQGTADSEADFCEQLSEDIGDIPKDFPNYIVIDWEATWNSSLRFDYFCERDKDGELHFFRHI